jgi:hypothetical protein
MYQQPSVEPSEAEVPIVLQDENPLSPRPVHDQPTNLYSEEPWLDEDPFQDRPVKKERRPAPAASRRSKAHSRAGQAKTKPATRGPTRSRYLKDVSSTLIHPFFKKNIKASRADADDPRPPAREQPRSHHALRPTSVGQASSFYSQDVPLPTEDSNWEAAEESEPATGSQYPQSFAPSTHTKWPGAAPSVQVPVPAIPRDYVRGEKHSKSHRSGGTHRSHRSKRPGETEEQARERRRERRRERDAKLTPEEREAKEKRRQERRAAGGSRRHGSSRGSGHRSGLSSGSGHRSGRSGSGSGSGGSRRRRAPPPKRFMGCIPWIQSAVARRWCVYAVGTGLLLLLLLTICKSSFCSLSNLQPASPDLNANPAPKKIYR